LYDTQDFLQMGGVAGAKELKACFTTIGEGGIAAAGAAAALSSWTESDPPAQLKFK
jgi:hypothetical protein